MIDMKAALPIPTYLSLLLTVAALLLALPTISDATAVAAAGVSIDVDLSNITHVVNPLFLGCHSDTGYAQQSRGLFSQLVMDESFEFEQHKAHPPPCYPEKGSDCKNGNGIGWTQLLPAGTKATIALDSNRSMNGFHSMQVAVQSGIAGLANRGNGGSGLFIEASRSYEGYFFTAADASADVRVSLYNRDTNSSLGSTTVHIAPSTSFTQQNFTVSTTASAACTDVIRCAGELRIEVVGRGRVNFDFVFLQPGSWGRYAGLPVLRSGAELLLQMGIKSIRVGGSFAGRSPWYEWHQWTGPIWKRPSVGITWGNDEIAGWGPFDFAEFAMAAGIEPVMTTTSTTTPQSFAELVEYCWGNISTPMGAKRETDGHPLPYRIQFFELGNEGSDGAIDKDGSYVEQVVAMETKAKQLGMGGRLRYLFPSGGHTDQSPSLAYAQFLSPHDLDKAVKAVQSGLVNAEQMIDSIHLGHHPYYWGGGASGLARHLFELVQQKSKGVLAIGAANTETNAKEMSQNRAMMEAGDLNDWFNTIDIAERIHLRAASFCMAQGDNTDEIGFTQGLAAFLPNGTFLQPPGHVHAMVSSTWQPNGLRTAVSSGSQGASMQPDVWGSRWNNTVTASAAISDDKRTVVVRIHSNSTQSLPVQVALTGSGTVAVGANWKVNATVLAAPSLWSVNSPAAQTVVAPKKLHVATPTGAADRLELTLPPHAYVTLTVENI